MTINFKSAAGLAAVVLIASATGAAAAGAKAPSIEGVWKVTNVVITGAEPQTIAKPQENLLILSRGHYAQVAVTGDKARTASPALKTAGKPTDAEKIQRYDEWAPVQANAGTYEVKGGKLIRTASVAKNLVAVTGGPTEAEMTLSGNTMTLTSTAPTGQPARVQKLTLTRVK
ncbi:MAG: hypothetical protein ACJ798_02795 [Phenylobacterium sp.]